MGLEKVAPKYFEFTNFWKGLDWTSPPIDSQEGFLFDCDNFEIVKGGLEKRWGIFSHAASGDITTDIIGIIEMKAANMSPSPSFIHLARHSTAVYVMPDFTPKANIKMNTTTLALTNECMTYMTKYDGMVYCSNGTDNNFKIAEDLRGGGANEYAKAFEVGLEQPTAEATMAKNASDSTGITGKYRYKYVYKRTAEAMEIYCDAGDATAASAKKIGDTITLVITGGTSAGTSTFDTSNSSYDTLDELVTAINGTGGWSCTQRWDNDPTAKEHDDFDTSFLVDFNAIDVLGSDNTCYPAFNYWSDLRSNPSKKSALYTAGAHYKNMNLETGDGATKTFNTGLTVSSEYVKAGSIEFTYVIGGQEYTGIDDEEGGFEGEYIDTGSSSVTYTTGAYTLVFDKAPTNDSEIIFNYDTSESVTVTLTVPTDTSKQINVIEVYRTDDMLGEGVEDTESTVYLKVGEVINDGSGTVTFTDTTDDADKTLVLEENNTAPPKAVFIKQHKDRLFYGNCPEEQNGKSLVVFSKSGQGEACPSTQYQYIDYTDGFPITGMASFGEYLVIFKKNKIAVIEGDFESLYYIAVNVGCIAPRSIVEFKDKVIFMSQQGWYSFDGVNLVNISMNINKGVEELEMFEGDTNLDDSQATGKQIFAFYDPERHKYTCFVQDPQAGAGVSFNGYFIDSIMGAEMSDANVSNTVAWTTHTYPNHKNGNGHLFMCAAPITNSDGSTYYILGDQLGNIYKYNWYGKAQDYFYSGANYGAVTATLSTGWSSLGTPLGISKTIRNLQAVYMTDAEFDEDCYVYIYADSTVSTADLVADDTIELLGSNNVWLPQTAVADYVNDYLSPWGDIQYLVDSYDVNARGSYFMLKLTHDKTSGHLYVKSLGLYYRPEGIRKWTVSR